MSAESPVMPITEELVMACSACVVAILTIEKLYPTRTDWFNLEAARQLARRAIKRYENKEPKPILKEQVNACHRDT